MAYFRMSILTKIFEWTIVTKKVKMMGSKQSGENLFMKTIFSQLNESGVLTSKIEKLENYKNTKMYSFV